MFIIFTDNITKLFIRGICVYSENNFPIRIICESLYRDHPLDITEVHFQLAVPEYCSTLGPLDVYVREDNTCDQGHMYI